MGNNAVITTKAKDFHSIYDLYDFIENTLFTMGVNENVLSVTA